MEIFAGGTLHMDEELWDQVEQVGLAFGDHQVSSGSWLSIVLSVS